MLRGDTLLWFEMRQGVRVVIVAEKFVKANGAKGGRKMNV